jgi:hypothetical protein
VPSGQGGPFSLHRGKNERPLHACSDAVLLRVGVPVSIHRALERLSQMTGLTVAQVANVCLHPQPFKTMAFMVRSRQAALAQRRQELSARGEKISSSSNAA